jgi:hypothetical protein
MPLFSFRVLTTILTTTMTTVGLLDTHTYTTIGPLSCLVTPSACAYGSEGWGFESLRAHAVQRRFPSMWSVLCWFFDDSFDDPGVLPAPEDQLSAGSEGRGFESLRTPSGSHPTCSTDAYKRESASAIAVGCHLADRRTTIRVRDRRPRLNWKAMLDPAGRTPRIGPGGLSNGDSPVPFRHSERASDVLTTGDIRGRQSLRI